MTISTISAWTRRHGVERDLREPAVRLICLLHTRTVAGVDRALSLGVVDSVIDPAHTRRKIAEALAFAPSIRGEHGNIPL